MCAFVGLVRGRERAYLQRRIIADLRKPFMVSKNFASLKNSSLGEIVGANTLRTCLQHTSRSRLSFVRSATRSKRYFPSSTAGIPAQMTPSDDTSFQF
eukprot:124478-Rhodomonas_salina.1